MSSTSDISRWDLAAVGLIVALLYGMAAPLFPETPPADPVLEALKNADIERGPHLYGLSPLDISQLASIADEHDRSVGIASFPGRESLRGPVLTRANALQSWLSKTTAEQASLQEVGGGWRRVEWDETDATSPLTTPSLSEAQIRVREQGNDTTESCTRVGLERFQCDRPEWAFTGRHRAKVAGEFQSCIWSHPLEGRTTVIDYGRVSPAPDDEVYVLQTALDDRVLDGPGAVDVDVRVGDRTISHRNPSDKGWHRLELPAFDEPTRLTLEISAETVGRRHFCYRFSTS